MNKIRLPYVAVLVATAIRMEAKANEAARNLQGKEEEEARQDAKILREVAKDIAGRAKL